MHFYNVMDLEKGWLVHMYIMWNTIILFPIQVNYKRYPICCHFCNNLFRLMKNCPILTYWCHFITLNSRCDNLKDSTQKDVKDKIGEQSMNQTTPINNVGNDVFTLTKRKGVGIASLHSLHIRWLQASIAHKLLIKKIGKRLVISTSQMNPHCKNQWVWLFKQGNAANKRECGCNLNNLLK